MTQPPVPQRSVWLTGAAIVCLFAYAAFLFSLPCFPSEDGPVHMYYVHVLAALLTHSNPQYEHFFHIRHLLPPYSLYYYALLLLSKFVPMLWADKLIIGAYVVSFIFGFRYLARAIGPSSDLITLVATLLLFNWPLGMGFVNFCLSLSFAFWATGLWLRIMGTARTGARIGFLALVTAIMLTHPVPLMLLLAVCGAFLAVRLFRARANATGGSYQLPANALADFVTLALATLNMAYVKLFALANPLKQVHEGGDAEPYSTYLGGVIYRLSHYAREHALAFVMGTPLDVSIYRLGLWLILLVPMALAVQQRFRNRAARIWTPGDTFLLLGSLILIGLPFIPSQLNGLYYFADRLVICVWLCFLLAATGWDCRNVSLSPKLIAAGTLAFTALTTGALLHSANRLLRPYAAVIAASEHQPIDLHGKVGFVLEDEREPTIHHHSGISWNPFYWADIHMVRANDAVLANAPWMHETIIPVAPSAPLPEVSIPALQEPFPIQAVRTFRAAPADLHAALNASDFFIVDQHDRDPLTSTDPLLQIDAAAAGRWHCQTGKPDWFRLCIKNTH